MHDHRKYHWLYFVLGICIAVILATLMGCEQPNATSGVIKEAPPIQCCMALTPECYAQCEGILLDEWVDNTCGTLAIDVEYGYWDEINKEPVWLCKAEIIN